MAATNSTTFPVAVSSEQHSSRDFTEVIVGFLLIMAVLWLPTREQLIIGPIVLLTPLALTLLRPASRAELGLAWRGLLRAFWILPAAVALTFASIYLAQKIGSYHPLYRPDLSHVGGYVLWTIYQQFLLQDFFMPRLTRLFSSNAAISMAGGLFAVAHLPNLALMLVTLAWGIASCWLFRRYRSLWVLGLAQGLLGLSFAVCMPDAMIHHMRVGLGYLRYHPLPAGQTAGYHGPVVGS